MRKGFEKNNSSPSPEEIKRLVQSPEAQRLIAMLNRDGGTALKKASQAAERGDYDTVRQLLSPKLNNPEAEELLHRLEKNG